MDTLTLTQTATDLGLRESTWRAMGATKDSVGCWQDSEQAHFDIYPGGRGDSWVESARCVTDLPAVESDPAEIGRLLAWLKARARGIETKQDDLLPLCIVKVLNEYQTSVSAYGPTLSVALCNAVVAMKGETDA